MTCRVSVSMRWRWWARVLLGVAHVLAFVGLGCWAFGLAMWTARHGFAVSVREAGE